jgi:plastocyanin
MTHLTLRARVVAATVAALLIGGVAGCGSSSHTTSATTSMSGMKMSTTTSGSAQAAPKSAAMHATVDIVDFTFKPMSITVKVGGTVTWKQMDTTGHSVESSSTPPAWKTSAVLKKGQSFSHTFAKAGTYHYLCGVHNYMTGTVVVVH